MGVCFQKPPKINKVIKTSQNNKRSDSINQQNSCQDNTRLYFSELQENFPDLPEWPGEIYKGFGIKRMKSFELQSEYHLKQKQLNLNLCIILL